MPIIFNCPACGRQLEAADENAGSPGTCNFCGSTIAAPDASGEPGGLITARINHRLYRGVPIDQPTGTLDLGRIVSESWDLLKRFWWALFAASLASGLMMMVPILPVFIAFIYWGSTSSAPPLVTFQVSTRFMGIEVLMLAAMVFCQPLAAGQFYVADRIVATETVDLGLILAPLRHYRALLKLSVVLYAPGFILMPVAFALLRLQPEFAFVGFIVAMPLTMLLLGLQVAVWQPALIEVVDRGVDGFDAARASWEFTKGHRWMIVLVTIIMGILAGLGEYACYVGLVFTAGFAPLGHVLIYRHLRGLQGTQG